MRAWAVALFACASCSARAIPAVPPAGVDRVAAVHATAGGELSGPGLFALASGAVELSAPDEGTTYLLGFSDADLVDRLGPLPSADVLTTSALRKPDGCEQTLPAPRWAMRVDVAEGALASDGGTLPLTADWAVDRCGPREVSARVTCGGALELCPVRRVVQDHCAFTIELGCTAGTISVQRSADALCPVTQGCTRTAAGVISCSAAACEAPGARCRTDAYAGRDCEIELDIEPAPPAPTVARKKLAAGPYRVPPIGNEGNIGLDVAPAGYLHGVTRVRRGADERIVTAVSGWGHTWSCGDDPTRAFVFVDPATLTAEAPVPAPDCVARLVEDPTTPGAFLASYRDGDTFKVARFDASGARLATVDVVTSTAGRAYAGGLAASRDGIYAAAQLLDQFSSQIVRIDPATMTVTASRRLHRTELYDIALTSEGWVAVLNDDGNTVAWLAKDLATCVGSGSFGIVRDPVSDLGGIGAFAVAFSADPRRLVVAVNERPAVHILDELCNASNPTCFAAPGVCGYSLRAPFTERAGEPLGLGAWSRRPRRVAVSGTGRTGAALDHYTALLGFLDVETSRFDRGTIVLGDGIAREMVEDASGRLFVLLPWAGELVRVSE